MMLQACLYCLVILLREAWKGENKVTFWLEAHGVVGKVGVLDSFW